MSWISLISGLVKIVGLITEWMERTRLINQGKKEQVNASLLEWKKRVEKSRAARDSVPSYLSGVRDDPDRRD
jgi:hypothetical protein